MVQSFESFDPHYLVSPSLCHIHSLQMHVARLPFQIEDSLERIDIQL